MRLAAIAALALIAAQDRPEGGPDPSSLDPEKEWTSIQSAAKTAAAKGFAYEGRYFIIDSDSFKDQSTSVAGAIRCRYTPGDTKNKRKPKPANWAIELRQDNLEGGEEPSMRSVHVPAKYLDLWPASKEYQETDPAKEKKPAFWPIVGRPLGDLMGEYDAKMVRLGTRYVLKRTQKSSMGGETNPEGEGGKTSKPGFDGARSHMLTLKPMNASVAAACKVINVSVDDETYIVTRVEFDWKGDGMLKSIIHLKDLDVGADIKDDAFQADLTGWSKKP